MDIYTLIDDIEENEYFIHDEDEIDFHPGHIYFAFDFSQIGFFHNYLNLIIYNFIQMKYMALTTMKIFCMRKMISS